MIGRVVLRHQIKDILLERILSGHYAPGERLVETRIAQEVGTSQAPVREALRDLESLGFVESAPYRGARVREVPISELLEIYPVRTALEELAAREAAVRLERDVTALEQEIEEMRRAVAADDVSAQFEHDARFHRLIVAAAANTTLLTVWDSLNIHSRTAITFLKSSLPSAQVVESHVPILDALRKGDPEVAAAAIRTHFKEFADSLQRERTPT